MGLDVAARRRAADMLEVGASDSRERELVEKVVALV